LTSKSKYENSNQSTDFFSDVDIRIDNESSLSSDRNILVKNPTTPPSSHSDSSESTLGSSDEAFSPAPKRKRKLLNHL
jgi:hypothetical protein